MSDLRALLGDKYDDTIEKARLAIEDELIELRDAGVFVPNRNGLTVNDRDGSHNGIRRMSTAMGVHATLAAVLPELLAEAWDECCTAWQAYLEGRTDNVPPLNPYRPETTAGEATGAPETLAAPDAINPPPDPSAAVTEPHSTEGARP